MARDFVVVVPWRHCYMMVNGDQEAEERATATSVIEDSESQ